MHSGNAHPHPHHMCLIPLCCTCAFMHTSISFLSSTQCTSVYAHLHKHISMHRDTVLSPPYHWHTLAGFLLLAVPPTKNFSQHARWQLGEVCDLCFLRLTSPFRQHGHGSIALNNAPALTNISGVSSHPPSRSDLSCIALKSV